MIDDEADFDDLQDAPAGPQTTAKFRPKVRAKPQKKTAPSNALGTNPSVATATEEVEVVKVGSASQEHTDQEHMAVADAHATLTPSNSKAVDDDSGSTDVLSEDLLTVSLASVSNHNAAIDAANPGVSTLHEVLLDEKDNDEPSEEARHQERTADLDTQASLMDANSNKVDDLADFGGIIDTPVEEERVTKFRPKLQVKPSKAASKPQTTNPNADVGTAEEVASIVDASSHDKEDGTDETGHSDGLLREPRHQESEVAMDFRASLVANSKMIDDYSADCSNILNMPVQEVTKFCPKLRLKPGKASAKAPGTNHNSAAAPTDGASTADMIPHDKGEDILVENHDDDSCPKPRDQGNGTVSDTRAPLVTGNPEDADATVSVDSLDEPLYPPTNSSQSPFGAQSVETTVKFQPKIDRKKKRGKSVSFVLPDASEAIAPTDTNSEHCISKEQNSNDQEDTGIESQCHLEVPEVHAVDGQKLDVGEIGSSMKLRSRKKMQKVGILEHSADDDLGEDYVEPSIDEQDNDSSGEYTAGGKQKKVRKKSREKDASKEHLRKRKSTSKDSSIEESQQNKNKSEASLRSRKRIVKDSSIEQSEKKLTHRIRQKRMKEVKTLLETPEHEIDHMKLSVMHLRLLQEAKERIKGKELPSGPSSSNQISQSGGYEDDFDFFGDGEENLDNYGTNNNGLRQFGTDFAMIQQLFPDTTRDQVRQKFKTEEKKHPLQVHDAIVHRSVDNSYFKKVIEQLNIQDVQLDINTKHNQGGSSEGGPENENVPDDFTIVEEEEDVNWSDKDQSAPSSDVNHGEQVPADDDDELDVFDWY